ncbi:MAG: DoxX family protein [Hyphomicrobiales bacterium]
MLNGILPASWSGYTHSLLRIVAGLAFLEHGTAKILKFPNIDAMLQQMGMVGGMLWFTGLVELVGGILIVLGLFTRTTAFVLSGFMAVAYFLAHAPQGFFPMLNMGEPALLYSFIFLWLATAGAGPWSLDAKRAA